MKTLLSLLIAVSALTGCAVVPVPAGPRYAYAVPPPPVVVVRPYYQYGWHRRWY
jgi:hypothetical protein